MSLVFTAKIQCDRCPHHMTILESVEGLTGNQIEDSHEQSELEMNPDVKTSTKIYAHLCSSCFSYIKTNNWTEEY